jgi:hypothetical protein
MPIVVFLIALYRINGGWQWFAPKMLEVLHVAR